MSQKPEVVVIGWHYDNVICRLGQAPLKEHGRKNISERLDCRKLPGQFVTLPVSEHYLFYLGVELGSVFVRSVDKLLISR